jgi:hypothetical protein
MEVIKVLHAHVTNKIGICHQESRLREFEHSSKAMRFQLIVLILEVIKSGKLDKYLKMIKTLVQTNKTSAKARDFKIVFAMFPKNGTGLMYAIPFFAQ